MIHILIIGIAVAVIAYSQCCTDKPNNELEKIAEVVLAEEGVPVPGHAQNSKVHKKTTVKKEKEADVKKN